VKHLVWGLLEKEGECRGTMADQHCAGVLQGVVRPETMGLGEGGEVEIKKSVIFNEEMRWILYESTWDLE
jgi:hypothetical protein